MKFQIHLETNEYRKPKYPNIQKKVPTTYSVGGKRRPTPPMSRRITALGRDPNKRVEPRALLTRGTWGTRARLPRRAKTQLETRVRWDGTDAEADRGETNFSFLGLSSTGVPCSFLPAAFPKNLRSSDGSKEIQAEEDPTLAYGKSGPSSINRTAKAIPVSLPWT